MASAVPLLRVLTFAVVGLRRGGSDSTNAAILESRLSIERHRLGAQRLFYPPRLSTCLWVGPRSCMAQGGSRPPFARSVRSWTA
jgi:hypothetical protein